MNNVYLSTGSGACIKSLCEITMNVESEYIKLCEIIDEEPLENIKEIISPFRIMMENWSRGISTG